MNTSSMPNPNTPGELDASAPMRISVKRVIACLSVVLIGAIVILGFWGWQVGLFTSAEVLSDFLGNMGPLAPVVFLLFQVLQVVIPVIPGGVTCSVGVIAFGSVWGFVLNYAGLVIGSALAFTFARRFGMALIKSIIPEKAFARYSNWLDKEQKLFDRLFAVAIFLPFAPDDLICMLAGVSKMKKRTFWLIILTLKIPFLLPYSFGLPAIMRWIGL